MTAFLDFFKAERVGILVLALCALGLGGLVNWALWMFGWGRFRGAARTDSKIRFVVADFFVKIINDFRHLLALVIVVIFAGALLTAMWPGMMRSDVTLIKDGLQAVAAALSGLLGSVIGYYFGESAANKRLNQERPPNTTEAAVVEAATAKTDLVPPQKPENLP